MRQTADTRSRTRPSEFLRGLRSPMRWLLPWVACVLLLPLPVPMMHRHDSIDASHVLASHLAIRHADSDPLCIEVDEPHWHFVLPLQSRREGSHEDGFPNPPTNFVSSSVATAPSTSSFEFVIPDVPMVAICDWSESRFECYLRTKDPRQRSAADALLRDRCVLSCVMRC
ncbi:hypothetical protein [Neorhodopirellula lusitana]|uniref:hypothetical protein n=1 Tax=Neorhodopirellula lusitana TaxID=445327 RepID=UPI003850F9FD